MPLLLGWTGVRGVVSLAAALAIPVTLAHGSAFPHKNLTLNITFIVILLTLVVQGLTLPYFIKRTNLFNFIANGESEESSKLKMKAGLKQHVYEFLNSKYEDELNDCPGLEKILKQWEEKIKSTDDGWATEKTKAIFVECSRASGNILQNLTKTLLSMKR